MSAKNKTYHTIQLAMVALTMAGGTELRAQTIINTDTEVNGVTVPGSGGNLTISHTTNDPTLTLNGGATGNFGFLTVGENNNESGNLAINEGSSVSASIVAIIARYAGSTGSISVDGSGSSLAPAILQVGDSGDGVLSITNGATATVNMSTVIGSSGMVTVDGTDSQLLASSSLTLKGNSTLNVINGGSVNANLFFGSYNSLTGNGTISLKGMIPDDTLVLNSGTGSFGSGGTLTLDMGAATYIGAGYVGVGSLTLIGGTLSTSAGGYAGYLSGSDGTLTIDGTSWTNPGAIYAGYLGGTGTLRVTGGGNISSGSLVAGYQVSNDTTPMGTIQVSGTGSMITTGSVLLGRQGPGFMELSSGGQLISSVDMQVGSGVGVRGELTVTSQGQLTSNGPFSIAEGAGSTGVVTVSGSGTELQTRDHLSVGKGGSGTLNINSGALVNTAEWDVVVGRDGNSTGVINVDGSNSRLIGRYFTVGYLGSGEMHISNGGYASSASVIVIGHGSSDSDNSLFSGTLTVDGVGSRVDAEGVVLGLVRGPALLEVSNGGRVVSTGLQLNSNVLQLNNNVLNVVIDGAGSEVELTVGGPLIGGGTVRVSDGGKLTSFGSQPRLSAEARLEIGNGGAAGILNALQVTGSGFPLLVFNHNDVGYVLSTDGTAGGTGVDITGELNLEHSGPGTTLLSGTVDHSGRTVLADGTLHLADNSSLTGVLAFNGGSVTHNAPTLDVGGIEIGAQVNSPVLNPIVAANSFTITGSGDLRLTDDLAIGVDLDHQGTLRMQGGNLSLVGGMTMSDTAVWSFEVAGTTPADHDSVSVTGQLVLDGTLNVQYTAPAFSASSLTLATADSITGSFDSVNLPGEGWSLEVLGNSLVLKVPDAVDLAISKAVDQTLVSPGDLLGYTLSVSNNGSTNVTDARVEDLLPGALINASWSCTATGAASCAPTGNGNIDELVSLPVGDAVTFSLTVQVDPATAELSVTNTATVTVPVGLQDLTPGDNTASVSTNTSLLFNNGFEAAPVVDRSAEP